MQNSDKFKHLPFFAILLTMAIKCVFLLTHHIQEDAFITWRVAQNLLEYGVIGFNGDVKISASTTHLYVFLSAFFNLIFGKEHFIEPLLVFNSLLFSVGSYFLAKLLLKTPMQQALFIFIFGILPPAIKISILGMEYGLLFFLEMAFLYFGIYKSKKWAVLLIPTLILFTRMDAVIFLGIVFLVDWIFSRKIRWTLLFGGIIGISALLGFNLLYFHEWVNNTIVAKKLAYINTYTTAQNWEYFVKNYGNFWGMLKVPGDFNVFTIILLVFEWVCFIFLVQKREKSNLFLWIIFLFGWVKQILFLSQKSLFDWYYWVPQILLFVPIIVFVLEQKRKKYLWLGLLLVFYSFPLVVFQAVHSIATGNGEWRYRRNIGLYLGNYEKDKNQWIFLEPAGYIPYFSGLKTIDEVGLVDKGVQLEILRDRKNFWRNTVMHRKPKYILSYKDLFQSKDASYYKMNYQLLKEFRIKNHLESDNQLIEKIYHLKPSGTDYNLYIRKK